MRIVVTGGAGFIGSHLVARLYAERDAWGISERSPVVVLDNLYRADIQALKPGVVAGLVRFVEGDVRDADVVARAVEGAEVVFHLAALSNVMGAEADPDYTYSTNVGGTSRVLEAALAQGVRRVVVASSREVYGDPAWIPASEATPIAPKNTYGASKAAAEMACRAAVSRGPLDVIALRMTNVYGPGDTGRVIPLWLERAARGEDLVLYGGSQVLDLVWVGDVVTAFLRAARVERARFVEAGLTPPVRADEGFFAPLNVGCGRGTSLVRLAAQIGEALDGEVRIRTLPARAVEVEGFVAEISALQHVLDFQPDTTLRHLRAMARAACAVATTKLPCPHEALPVVS